MIKRAKSDDVIRGFWYWSGFSLSPAEQLVHGDEISSREYSLSSFFLGLESIEPIWGQTRVWLLAKFLMFFCVFWLTNFIRFYKSHKSTQLGHRFSRLKYFAMQIPSKARKWDEFAIIGSEALSLWNWSGMMKLEAPAVSQYDIHWQLTSLQTLSKELPINKINNQKLIVNHFTLFWFY